MTAQERKQAWLLAVATLAGVLDVTYRRSLSARVVLEATTVTPPRGEDFTDSADEYVKWLYGLMGCPRWLKRKDGAA